MNRRELRWALYCCAEVLNTRTLRKLPIPADLKDYFEELQNDWAAMSVGGPISCASANQNPNIDAEEAAMLMHCTPRNARRRAEKDPSLGQRISGVWVFDRAAVEDHSKNARAHRKAPSA